MGQIYHIFWATIIVCIIFFIITLPTFQNGVNWCVNVLHGPTIVKPGGGLTITGVLFMTSIFGLVIYTLIRMGVNSFFGTNL